MTEDSNKATTRRVLEEFFTAGKLDLAPELFSPDVAEGDRVALRSIARGTNSGEFMGTPPTGKRFSVEWESIYRFEGGKVAEIWDAWNVLAVMEQLGLVPEAAA